MIALIAYVLAVVTSLLGTNADVQVVTIPAKPSYAPAISEAQEWDDYRDEYASHYSDVFTALFNSYETKVAKNGAMMIRRGNSGSFKFAKKGN